MGLRANYLAAILAQSAAPFAPSSVSSLWLDPATLSAGAVASWVSSDTLPQTVSQGTGTAQPTASTLAVAFDGADFLTRSALNATYQSATTLPNGASNSETGKGFTCTGLAKAPNGTWWVANHGKKNETTEGSETFLPSLVNLSADFSTIVSEILLVPLYASIGTVQGVAYDTSDDTLWIASTNESKIHHLTTAGVHLGSITLTFSPNGLGYDSTDDALWVNAIVTDAAPNTVQKISCADGSVLINGAIALANHDQIHIDAATRTMMVSAGGNGSTGQVFCYNIAAASGNPPLTGYFNLDSTANTVEGIHWDSATGIVTVCNDAYYHNQPSALNRVLRYKVPTPVSTRMDLAVVLTVPTTTGTDAIFTVGDPLASAGVGVGLFAASNTELRAYVHSGGATTTTQSSLLCTGLTLTSKCIAYLSVDLSTDTMTMWINGTQVGTSSAAATLGHLGQCGTLRVCAAADGSGRYPTATLGDLFVSMGDGQRQKMEGYLAHKHSLTGALPGGHPYKTVAP